MTIGTPRLHDGHDHDGGLGRDLELIGRRMVARRKALAWVTGIGAGALLTGCKSGGGGTGSTSSAGTTTSTGTTSTGSTGTGSTTTTTTTTTGSGQCVADPAETAGPYPADGTNSSSGSTSNVLTQSGIVRSDIRSSFLTGTTVAPGVLVTITLTLVDVNSACAPLAGYAIYFWQCDRDGHYSLYSAPTESYLRGVQVTDASGQVTFVTIFPACYDGRWPHMHFEVFRSLSVATGGRAAALTSQLAMPSALCTTIYNGAAGYGASVANFAKVSLATDLVFGDNSTAQNAQMTPAFSGSIADGYAATATIGLAA